MCSPGPRGRDRAEQLARRQVLGDPDLVLARPGRHVGERRAVVVGQVVVVGVRLDGQLGDASCSCGATSRTQPVARSYEHEPAVDVSRSTAARTRAGGRAAGRDVAGPVSRTGGRPTAGASSAGHQARRPEPAGLRRGGEQATASSAGPAGCTRPDAEARRPESRSRRPRRAGRPRRPPAASRSAAGDPSSGRRPAANLLGQRATASCSSVRPCAPSSRSTPPRPGRRRRLEVLPDARSAGSAR